MSDETVGSALTEAIGGAVLGIGLLTGVFFVGWAFRGSDTKTVVTEVGYMCYPEFTTYPEWDSVEAYCAGTGDAVVIEGDTIRDLASDLPGHRPEFIDDGDCWNGDRLDVMPNGDVKVFPDSPYCEDS